MCLKKQLLCPWIKCKHVIKSWAPLVKCVVCELSCSVWFSRLIYVGILASPPSDVHFWQKRSRRLEEVGERENGRARGRHALIGLPLPSRVRFSRACFLLCPLLPYAGYVYRKRQASDSSWEFLKIENRQRKSPERFKTGIKLLIFV